MPSYELDLPENSPKVTKRESMNRSQLEDTQGFKGDTKDEVCWKSERQAFRASLGRRGQNAVITNVGIKKGGKGISAEYYTPE